MRTGSREARYRPSSLPPSAPLSIPHLVAAYSGPDPRFFWAGMKSFGLSKDRRYKWGIRPISCGVSQRVKFTTGGPKPNGKSARSCRPSEGCFGDSSIDAYNADQRRSSMLQETGGNSPWRKSGAMNHALAAAVKSTSAAMALPLIAPNI